MGQASSEASAEASGTAEPEADPVPMMRVLHLPDYSRSNPYQSQLAAALRAFGVSVMLGRSSRRRRLLPILGAYWNARRPPILHLHWIHPYLWGAGASFSRLRSLRFLLELLMIRLLGGKIVWTVHNLTRHDRPDPRELQVNRWLVRLASGVIVHCEAAAELAIATFRLSPALRERIRVIPHGHYRAVYPKTLDPTEARARLGLPAGVRAFVFLGSIRPYKGVIELIEAFRDLDRSDVRLIIAGHAPDAAFAAAVAQAAADDSRVMLQLEFVPEGRIQEYLLAADAMVLPFQDVLTSGSAILGMSFGRAVIAPRLGCLPQTIDPAGGVLYDPAAPDALGAALNLALEADLATMGARNLARCDDLDWMPIAAATFAIYSGARWT